MSDFFEVDFLSVECDKSGDAIAIRYKVGEVTSIHLVDCGFIPSAEGMLSHLEQHYSNPHIVDHLVVTHGDSDHASGVRTILERFPVVSNLWMHRPWLYAEALLPRTNFGSVERLVRHLRNQYPLISEIEKMASDKGIPIRAPFQGARIGAFIVLSPSPQYYVDLILNSSKADIAAENVASLSRSGLFEAISESRTKYGTHPWGSEIFPPDDTPEENNTSIIQYAELSGKRLLLTGDAGRGAFSIAAQYAARIGITLPGLNFFQVPHHGSRHNVDTNLLNHWLGPILPNKQSVSVYPFTAVVSSAKKDADHPRKCVVRAMMHRGSRYCETKGNGIYYFGGAAPQRGWKSAEIIPYPEDQEEL